MSASRPGRRIFDTRGLQMQPYDLDGVAQPGISYAVLSYDLRKERGSYLMRMEPGTATIAHTHTCREEYLILEGEAIENDGAVLKAGDWIIYEPGSAHNTRTITGCLLLGLDWEPAAQ